MKLGPKPDSPGGRLLAFFRANPDEELTHDMAMIKFGCSRDAIHMAVARNSLLESLTVIRLKTKGIAK